MIETSTTVQCDYCEVVAEKHAATHTDARIAAKALGWLHDTHQLLDFCSVACAKAWRASQEAKWIQSIGG
jgi:hypothetical protein